MDGEVCFCLALGGECLLEGALQGSGHEAVLGLDRVELSACPVGFEARPLDRQLEDRYPLAMVLVGLGERLCRRRQAGRLEHGEDLVQHTVLELATTEALASTFSAIELPVATTDITGAVAGGAGVAGLHHPPAATAAEPALQQRRALPHRTATVAPRRAPVCT